MPSLSICFTSNLTVSAIIRVLLALIDSTIFVNCSSTATRKNSMQLSTIPAGVSPYRDIILSLRLP